MNKNMRGCIDLAEKVYMAGHFIKVKCEGCKNEQVIFNKASMQVKCIVCNAVLAEPTGGSARVLAKLIQELE